MTRPTKDNIITCEFGRPGTEWMAGKHTGIDYRAAVGTKIFATKGGQVVHAGPGGTYGSAYGNYVVIQTKLLGVVRQCLYAHLSKVLVKEGQQVKAGDNIGLSGESGHTFGPHLHYEERVAPFNYWSFRKPIFPKWFPKNRAWWKKIRYKIRH